MNESLEEDREYLLRSLADLEREHDAGDLDHADYLALKDDYTARAAQVLRALEQAAAAPAAGAPTAEGDALDRPGGEVVPGEAGAAPDRPRAGVTVATAPVRRSPARTLVVGAVLLAFAGGAGMLVARSAGERTPGQAATGSIAATGPAAGIADQLAAARDLIGRGETLEAIKIFDEIIEKDPLQPEALAYRGWLLRLAGRSAGNTALVEKGIEFIERAVAADPSYPDAHFFRAFVLYQDRNDPAAAVPELRTFLASDPPEGMAAVVQDLLSRALAESASGSPAPTAPSGSAPPAPAPG